jgi:hypothetical protein
VEKGRVQVVRDGRKSQQAGRNMVVLYVLLHRYSMPSIAAYEPEAEHRFLSCKLVAKPSVTNRARLQELILFVTICEG